MKIPNHIAIIMDGNGRWASRQGLPRMAGHEAGAVSVETVVTASAELGIGALTLYCLSSENWKRPKAELDALMELLRHYLQSQREKLLRENIRFQVIGQRRGIPDDVLDEIDETTHLCAKNSGLRLTLAINYGGRGEIVETIRRICREFSDSSRREEFQKTTEVNDKSDLFDRVIDEKFVADRLWTAGLPDPDLLIRTAGESRLSNFLLWQLSYAEIWITDVCWPDFGRKELEQALEVYARRDRKFGGLSEKTS